MTDKRRYKIVLGVDFSDISETVVETGLDLASRYEAADIHVVSVLAMPRGLRRQPSPDQGGELEELEKVLHAIVGEKLADFGRSVEDGRLRVYVHTRVGAAAEQIVYLAWESEADLIIVGRHGEAGWRRFLVGSVPDRVLRLARCPVLVVQPTDYGGPDLVTEEEAAPPCAECVAVRRDSDGAQWFCKEHSNYRLSRSVYMAHHSTSMPSGGGPLL